MMMKELLLQMEKYAFVHHVPIINERGKAVLVETIAKKKPHRVLEIGTAIGYSALLIAEYSAVDIKITTLELDEERAKVARGFIQKSRFKGQIEVILGDAAEKLMDLSESYDVIFIDAAKGQYVNYFRLALPLLADEGVIIADNVLFRGYVLGDEKPPRRYKTIVARLREYIETVMQHPDFETIIHDNGDGLAISYYKKHRRKTIEKA